MKLILSTNNLHKLREVREIIGPQIELLSLGDIGFSGDILEDQDTLEGNASQKAHYIYDKFKENCFADDTGLEVDALGGRPGVYSARYAGEDCSDLDNMEKLLGEMDGLSNRRARFRTVISLVIDGEEQQFEGVVEGEILREPRGGSGFGYDPIFQPLGFNRSFAEMSSARKNEISHRARALVKFAEFLRELD